MAPPRRLALVVAGLALLTGCGSGPGMAPPTGVDLLEVPTASPDPADFADRVDNPWLPLRPGNEWVYASTARQRRTTRVVVEPGTREIAGVATTSVREVTTDADGDVVEEGVRSFAQDRSGNVWSFAAATSTYGRGGRVVGASSWEAGEGGARAALAMPAEPRVGDGFAQEAAPQVAQRTAEVLRLDATASVPVGDFTGVLVLELTGEPSDEVGFASYARGVGLLLVEDADGATRELVSFSEG